MIGPKSKFKAIENPKIRVACDELLKLLKVPIKSVIKSRKGFYVILEIYVISKIFSIKT